MRIIERRGKAVLVEWLDDGDMLRRVTIPAGKLAGNDADEDALAAGVPYGLDWEALDFPVFDSAAFANELRRQGIWTAAEFLRQLHLVRAAIQKSYINPLLEELTVEVSK